MTRHEQLGHPGNLVLHRRNECRRGRRLRRRASSRSATRRCGSPTRSAATRSPTSRGSHRRPRHSRSPRASPASSTGIPGPMKQVANTLGEQSGGRFILGLGVSHGPMVAGLRGLDYSKPLTQMREYLAAMEAQPFRGPSPAEPVPVVLAALGPKMLELAATASDGAHPYWTTPDHTARARADHRARRAAVRRAEDLPEHRRRRSARRRASCDLDLRRSPELSQQLEATRVHRRRDRAPRRPVHRRRRRVGRRGSGPAAASRRTTTPGRPMSASSRCRPRVRPRWTDTRSRCWHRAPDRATISLRADSASVATTTSAAASRTAAATSDGDVPAGSAIRFWTDGVCAICVECSR